MSAHLEQW